MTHSMSPEEFFMYLTSGLIVMAPVWARIYRWVTERCAEMMLHEQFWPLAGRHRSASVKKDYVMRTPWAIWISLVVLMLGAVPACSQSETKPKGTTAPAPAELQGGEQKFAANCLACHGAGGVGTSQGPPLVHRIYEPNHHGDAAFQRAATNGVKAHHWKFGNMPKIDSVTPEDVDQIVKYVRWLQKQAGVF